MNVPSVSKGPVSKGPDWTEPSLSLRGTRHHRIASDTERQGCLQQTRIRTGVELPVPEMPYSVRGRPRREVGSLCTILETR
jgi:hypothetical protein